MTGRVLAGRYRLLELIGQGGMAVVYRAQDEMLAREVAVKVLRPAYAEDDAFVERFRREARNAAALLHPNIVTIHDTGTDEVSGDFIVMSLVDGPDLQKVIARYGQLPTRVRRAHRHRDRAGAPVRPRARHRAPRHQAREHP